MGDIVKLHGSPIDLNSDLGRAFVVDATRAAEGAAHRQRAAGKI